MEIATDKVAYIIVRARELDAKVAKWDDSSNAYGVDEDSDAILEDLSDDATWQDVYEFIAALNDDEKAELIALLWIGRGTYEADEWDEAVATAKEERLDQAEEYLLREPLLADYLEEGLEKLGISVSDIEDGML